MTLLKPNVGKDKVGHEIICAAEEISKLEVKQGLFEIIMVGNIEKHRCHQYDASKGLTCGWDQSLQENNKKTEFHKNYKYC